MAGDLTQKVRAFSVSATRSTFGDRGDHFSLPVSPELLFPAGAAAVEAFSLPESEWVDSAAYRDIASPIDGASSHYETGGVAEAGLGDSATQIAMPSDRSSAESPMQSMTTGAFEPVLEAQNGSVTVTRTTNFSLGDSDGDADGVADPGEVLSHYLVISNAGATPLTSLSFNDPLNGSTLNAGSVKITPVTVDDSFTMSGNTPQTFTFAQLIGNDLDFDGNAANLTITSVGGAQNGTVSIDTVAGTVTFTPTTGYTGAASFTYTVMDEQGLTNVAGSEGVVGLTISNQVWYVDSGYGGANGASDGSYLRPFTSLTALNGGNGDGSTNDDVDGANDTIFVYSGSYNGGITLETGQKLFGDGHALTVNGLSIDSSSSNTTINHATTNTGYGVTLATGNEIRGITFNGTNAGTVGIQDGNGTVGTLTIAGTSVTGTGKAVDIDQGGTLAVTLDTLSSSGSATEGVHLQGVSGSFTATGGAIQNSAGVGLLIGAAGGATASSGGNAQISYGGGISNAGGLAVEVQDRTGGTVTLTGSITETAGPGILVDGSAGTVNFGGQISLSTGASNAVVLNANSGTINFAPGGNGLDIVTTTGVGFQATNSGTVTLTGTGNSIQSSGGQLVNMTNTTAGTGGVNFGQLSATSGSVGTAFSANGVSGAVTVDSLAASGVTGTGISIVNSGGTFTFANAVQLTTTAGGRGVYLDNNDAGTVTFSGGGQGVDISAGSGGGFVAVNGGTVGVLGTGNTVTASGGAAINVSGTTISGSNLNFQSVSANGGANGIILNNTGSSGGLIVTGDGGNTNNGSGGTIQNMTGDGISLTNTASVRLGYMIVQNNQGDGIGGLNVDGFLLNRANVSGNGNEAAQDESGIRIVNLTGTAFNGLRPTGITNSVISNNHEFEVEIVNNGSGTLTDFQFTNNTVSDSGSSGTIANLVNFLNLGSGNMRLTASGGSYTGAAPNSGTALHIDHSGTGGTLTATVTGGTFTNNNVAVGASAANQGNLTFDIDGITATGNRSHGINVFVSANSTGAINGTIENNVIGTAGVTGSGAALGNGISIQNEGSTLTGNALRLLVNNNTIQEVQTFTALNVNSGIGGQANTRTMDLVLSNNVFGDVDGSRAIVVQQNNSTNTTGSAGILNASIFGNSFLGFIAGLQGDGSVMRLRQLSGGTFNLVQLADTTGADPRELDNANNLNNAVADRISTSGTFNFGASAPGAPAAATATLSPFEAQQVIAQMEAAGRAPATPLIVYLPETGQIAAFTFVPTTMTSSSFSGLDGNATGRQSSYSTIAGEPSPQAATGPIGLGSLPAGKSIGIYYTSTVNAQSGVITTPVTNAATVSYSGGTTTSNTETLAIDTLTLGNRVYIDVNRNGVFDAGDTGLNGVSLSLFVDANNDGIADGAAIASTVTAGAGAAAGSYSFSSLGAGTYIVQVNAANFQTGGALVGHVATTDGGDPDNNVDNDSNGINAAGGVVVARPVTLDYNTEPTTDGDSDADTNLTVDFGFFAPNVAPVLANLSGDVATFTEGGGPVLLDVGSNVTITDSDSANFGGGSLTVVITSGYVAGQDLVGLTGGGAQQVTITNNNVSVAGVVIGTVSSGSDPSTMSFTLNDNATPARVQNLIRAIGYINIAGDNPTGGSRTITFTLVDGDGTQGGGVDTVTSTTSVTVSPVDDAPVAVADTATVAENATQTVAVLDNDTDVDGGPKGVVTIAGQAASVGVAITLASGATATLTAEGTISYNPNGQFNALVSAATAAATGAQNATATDSFSYALNGGSSTTVTVTITGVDGSGDQIAGSAGNNTLTGTGTSDLFNLSQGGDDSAAGGAGDDGFYFGGAFNGNDSVDGGSGTLDTVGLQGDYSAGVTLGANSATNVEIFALLSGSDTRFGDTSGSTYSYRITTGDAAIAASQMLVFQANQLRAGENFTLDASGELDGSVFVYGGLGDETLTGGQRDDAFYFGAGRFGANDLLDGQGGTMDTLGLQGNYAGGNAVTFSAAQLTGIEIIALMTNADTRFGGAGSGTPYSYTLTMDNGNVAAGMRMVINANTLASDEVLTFNGAAELDGSFRIYAGNGTDVIQGSQGDDLISGRGGADTLTGNGGADRFVYSNASESTAAAADTITDFTLGDLIDLSGVDANTGLAGSQQFGFIGSAAFSNTAGELRVDQSGGSATIFGDLNGDGAADFRIDLTVADSHAITIADFVGVNAVAATSEIVAAPDDLFMNDGDILSVQLFSSVPEAVFVNDASDATSPRMFDYVAPSCGPLIMPVEAVL